MSPVPITIMVYKLDELDAKARQRAVSVYADLTASDWSPDMDDDWRTIAGFLGFEVEGKFAWDTGPGGYCVFVGGWKAERVDLAKLTEYAPQDAELHAIGAGMMGLALKWPTATALIRTVGSRSPSFYIDLDDGSGSDGEPCEDNDRDALDSLANRFGAWMRKQLHEETPIKPARLR